jgi:hypothetical protein
MLLQGRAVGSRLLSRLRTMAVTQLSMSARTAVGFTQPPTLPRLVLVLASSFSSQARNTPGVKVPFAQHPSSAFPALPMVCALAAGHAPLPGSSLRNAATHASTAASMPPPAQPPSALSMRLSACIRRLKRQLPSTPAPAFFAFA